MLSTGDFGKMDVMCLRIEILVIQLPCKGWACSVGDTKKFLVCIFKGQDWKRQHRQKDS